ncbi:MAG: glycosyltransferase family 4 protein [Candidatus Baldrarchaeia archaeon]
MISVAYFNEGVSIYDSFFLNKLNERFYVFLLTFNPKPKYVPKGIKVVFIPEPIGQLPVHDSPRLYSTILLKSVLLKKRLRDLKPQVLLGCGGLNYGFISACSSYKPFVLFIWGSDVLIWPKFLPFRAMAKYSLKKADLVVLDSYVQLRACIRLGCNKEKIVRLPWFDSMELEKLVKNVVVEKNKFRKKLAWNDEDPVIICTRRHEKIYNIETIIQAIPEVLKEVPNARFLFIGKGSLTEKLKLMTKKLDVKRNVRFAGFISHEKIFYYLRNSDIYVSSSLSDGTSASLLEAMTCKLACIVSDIPANREWITNMKNGLLFPTKDFKSLAEKIIDLIKQKDLAKKLGEEAFKTVRERANWNKNSKTLYDSIERLARK